MADLCLLDENNNSAGYDLVIDADGTLDEATASSEQKSLTAITPPFSDDCIDCNDCLCCAHLAPAHLNIEPLFHTPHFLFSKYAPPRLTNTYPPQLRPPKV